MSSISSLFSHVDWRNKGEVSMVMPVTSSLPEGPAIVPIVLHKRRRKEGQSRRKRACHSSPVIYNCAVVDKCLTQSLSIYRESESKCSSFCLCVGKLVPWRTRWIISHTFFDWCHATVFGKGGNTVRKVWISSITSSGPIRVATCWSGKWPSPSFIDPPPADRGVSCDSCRE